MNISIFTNVMKKDNKKSNKTEPPTEINDTKTEEIEPSVQKVTNLEPIQLTSGELNPVHEKRRWEESFTVAEKKALEGNIVKAAKDNDGETYVTLQQEEFVLTSNEDQEDDDSDESLTKKPGRKPLPDEENSDPEQDPKVKRKAQNRVAQRAFRERKERYVRELEAKLKQTQESNMIATTQLIRENNTLKSFIYRLEIENHALKGIPYTPSCAAPVAFENQTPYSAIAPLLPAPLQFPLPLLQDNKVKTVPIQPKKNSTPPLEYTFSISTPTSLRPPRANKKQVVEPVPLYSPDSLGPYDKVSPATEESDVSQPMRQLELDFIGCHIDVEGQRFCEKLHNEVCHETLSQLLCEPLFDDLGNFQPFMASKDKGTRLSAPEIWFALTEHPQFKNQSIEKLYCAVKDAAMPSDEGPVLEEDDMKRILSRMEQGLV